MKITGISYTRIGNNDAPAAASASELSRDMHIADLLPFDP